RATWARFRVPSGAAWPRAAERGTRHESAPLRHGGARRHQPHRQLREVGRVSTRIRRALVTGANGFGGARMVDRLLLRHVPTRALVRRRLRTEAMAPGLERVHGDVTRPESLRAAVAGCDVVFHCAWGGESMEDARRVNVEGTRHVLLAAAEAGVRRVVHLSTMAVHGDVLPPELT